MVTANVAGRNSHGPTAAEQVDGVAGKRIMVVAYHP